MAIKLFPTSERVNLNEDKDVVHSNYENYTGIVFDTEKNAFKVVTGKFRDKKDMYEKMTKANKYLRRAYESRIFDWIEKNAETTVDGYLMLSTAVSKWKNNNVLSKYYKKLLHDLPYVNREGRKGDPQTMGVKASFESVLKNMGKVLTEDDNKVNLANIEDYLSATFNDETKDLPVDNYNVKIGAKSNAETPVHDVNDSDKIIGKITSKVVKNEKGNPYNVVVDNQGNQLGYAFFPAGEVFSSLNKDEGDVIGTFTKYKGDSNFISPKDEREFINFEKVPAVSYYFDKPGTPNSVFKNYLITLRLAQAIKAGIIDNDNKGMYKVIISDRKGNEVATLSLTYSQIMSAMRELSQTYENGEYANLDRKNQEPEYMSNQEKQARELQQAYDTAAHPGNIAHQADMFTGVAGAYDRIHDLKKSQNRANKNAENQYDYLSGLAQADGFDLDKALGIDPIERDAKIAANKAIAAAKADNRAKAAVDAWNTMNIPAPQPTVEKDTANKVLDDLKKNSEEDPAVLDKANILAFRNKRKEFDNDVIKTRAWYNENPEEYKKDVLANIENAKTQEESAMIPAYVNDGAAALKQWTDATYINSASFQEASTHNELNQDLFDGKKLKADVREALIEIAKSFKDSVDLAYEPVDIYFTGSEANYNYNEHSDIDVHLVYDFEQVGPIAEMINHYLQTAKRVFNDKHQITVKGLPVEVGAEMKNTPLVTSGVYSLLNDEWVIEPENANKEIQEPEEPYYNEVKMQIEDAIISKDIEKIRNAVDFIWGIRKEGLANEGEFGPANTLFKQLRNEGLLGELRQAYYDAESEDLSLESMMKEAEFSSREEAKASISDDLFDKSEEEIVDGLMDHYENKEDAIAKIEDVMKTISDGYKDKLQNVITKIKESYSFSNKCKRIVEKAFKKLNEEENISKIIKTLGEKLATIYLEKYSDGDFAEAFDRLQDAKKKTQDITDLTDDDLKDLTAVNMTLDRVKPAVYTAAIDALQRTAKEKNFANDVKVARDNTPHIPSQEERYKRRNDLKAPSNFTVDSFVNLFHNEADLQIYLDIIRSEFPIALLDHSRKFYVVDENGKRLTLKGIEKGLYPQNVWVNEIELEPTGTKIGYFNGENAMDIKTNKLVGYVDGNEAYYDNGKLFGYLDRNNNIISPYGQFAHKEFWPVAAYSMPIEEYRRILSLPKNASTLEDAINTTQEELAKAGFDYSLEDVGGAYDQTKNAEKFITRNQAIWELEHIDDLKINHYDKMTRDLIYYKIAKKHMNPVEVMQDYESSYRDKPYYKPTKEMIDQLNVQSESTEEITEAGNKDWYTFSKKGNVAMTAKDYLEDMHIPTDEYFDAVLSFPQGDVFAGGNYKFSAISSNPNEGATIVSQNPVFQHAHIRPDNYIVTLVDGTEKVIGYSPLPRFDQYVENPNNYYNRPVYGFVNKDRSQMQLEGILKGWENNEVFKLIPVDGLGKKATGANKKEEHLTIKEMFDLLKLPENATQVINYDKLRKSDASSASLERKQYTSGNQNGQWIDLDDSEVLDALKYVASKNSKGTVDNKPYQEVINDFEKTAYVTPEVMKMLRLVDPRKTEFIKRQPSTGNVQLYVAYANAPKETPVKHKDSNLIQAARNIAGHK